MGLGYLLVFFEGQGNTAGVFVVIALLTVIGGTKESGPKAAAWVRRNLNR